MSDAQLRSNVHLLVNPRKVLNPNPNNTDPTKRLVDVLSLLEQLRSETGSGSEGGGGAGKGSRSPVAVGVLTLLDDIGKELSLRYEAMHGVDNKRMQLESKLIEVRDHVLASADELSIARLTAHTANWIADINEMISPVSKSPITGTCPECGVATLKVQRDGQSYTQPSLWFYGSKVYCHGCGTAWTDSEAIYSLSEAIHGAA